VDTGLACGQPFYVAAALLLDVPEAVDEAVPDEEEDDDDEDDEEAAFAAALSDEPGLPFDSPEPLAAARLSVR
jgi:hypothetical protein